MRRALTRAILIALTLLALPYGCRKAIYPFRTEPASPAGIPRTEAKFLPAAEGLPELEVWVAEPVGDRPVVIYFMGNAGSLAYSAPRIAEFTEEGFGIAAMTYRGGGGRPGEPSEAGLKSDALRLYRDLGLLFGAPVPEERRVIYGVSLGTGIATDLAARVSERALVLETPFTRLCDVAKHHYSSAPACAVITERYDQISRIADIGAPLLVLHGARDEMIPLSLAEALFEAAEEPKEMIVYPGGNHNDLRLFGAGADAIRFLEGL